MEKTKGTDDEIIHDYGTPRKSTERISTAEASRATIKMSSGG